MTDNEFLSRMISSNNKYLHWKLKLERNTDLLDYVKNRYNDSESIEETLYRIKHNIQNHPHCPYCKKSLNLINLFRGFPSTCQSRECLNKVYIDSLYKNQGVINVFQKESCKEKIKKTCLERYGAENIFGSEIGKEKIKKSLKKLYNVEYSGQLKKTQDAAHSLEANNKRMETKRKNHTFNTSKSEEKTYELLKTKFNDIKRQYKTELYPFNCDFYIPKLDLYIECNYSQYHNSMPFNENITECITELNKLKEKSVNEGKYGSSYHTNNMYDVMIYTWTDLDVRKRNIALKNKLNYLTFYSLKDFKKWFKQQNGEL